MEHAADGLFDNAAVTRWRRGKTAEVYWKSGAKHRGRNMVLVVISVYDKTFISLLVKRRICIPPL